MLNKVNLSKFGIGTYGIGGLMEKDPSISAREETNQVEALKYSIDKGLNYIDLSFLYADGYAIELVKRALLGVDRNKIFINAKLGNIAEVSDIKTELQRYMDFLEVDYLDSFQIHAPSRVKEVGVENTVEAIATLVERGLTRFVSVSNFGPDNLAKAHKIAGEKLFSLENDYSFDVRPCEDIGLLDYCNDNNILFMPYRPFRRDGSRIVNYEILKEISEKYEKTPNQILINWYAWKDNLMPVIKSATIAHIDENLAGLEFEMEHSDYERLDSFRINHPAWENIDWEYSDNGGTKISGLSKVF